MFVFVDKNLISDTRSVFANDVCRLIMQKNNGNIAKSLDEIEPIYNGFDENVRNVYELINNQIPLFALYDLKRLGADNYGMTEEEYLEAMSRTSIACLSYYC